MEYEIERLSVEHGPKLMQFAFVREHVALDSAHTAFNRRQIEDLLARHPGCLNVLVKNGEWALECYGGFLSDCTG